MELKKKIVQISAGKGPAECEWVVAKLLKEVLCFFVNNDVSYEVLNIEKGAENRTIKSVTIHIEGGKLDDFIKNWEGSILWKGKSPFRKFHKRLNWFVGITVYDVSDDFEFSKKDIRIDTFRASGSGGQHVNKTDSAVRIVHVPTNVMVTVSESPSQHMNKKIALKNLKFELEKYKKEELGELKSDKWKSHQNLERGNPKRVYKGQKFKLKK